jgi:hypothetical protein
MVGRERPHPARVPDGAHLLHSTLLSATRTTFPTTITVIHLELLPYQTSNRVRRAWMSSSLSLNSLSLVACPYVTLHTAASPP